MSPDWRPLDDELELWAKAGLRLPIWWRDDDAVAPGANLDRLARMASDAGLPLHLAVIPKMAEPALMRWLDDHPHVVVLVHGWAHRSHAPATEKKAEFGAHRPTPEALYDAGRGLVHLRDLFGDRVAPVFVPPWNRVAPGVVSGLAGLGFDTLSTYLPRKAAFAAPNLRQVNTHLDPIDWRGHRSLADADDLIRATVRQLADRRTGAADAKEPFGLLTHHLVHDAAIWDFTHQMVARLTNGPCHAWRHTPLAKDGATP